MGHRRIPFVLAFFAQRYPLLAPNGIVQLSANHLSLKKVKLLKPLHDLKAHANLRRTDATTSPYRAGKW